MPNSYLCEDGRRVSQSTINRLRSEAYRAKHEGNPRPVCGGCRERLADDNSHIIAQARCKELGKTNLIWDPGNMTDDCRTCHGIWESFKSGEWRKLQDVSRRLSYLAENDPQGYCIREAFSLEG